MEDPTTPTNESFARTALAAQKPLPTGFPDSAQNPDTANEQPSRPHSYHSRHSREPGDMNVNDSDGETAPTEDAVAASDDESVAADGTKPGKKKRSQRFYCTDYPPCNLSFTRSEHLARHIRKHTGERPFQCHCSRRFSRLDNLRQHAQTVHVNEDIPIDSLAATGTRFQRQIRTDRVRPTSGRARTSTAGNIGPPMRGHSKSLSTSSLASVASVSSVASSVYSTRDDLRRRPPPLVMAEPRSRLSLESPYRAGPDGSYRPLTPTEYSTPTSATFSKGPGSPRWGSAMVSPSPSHSRSHSLYSSGVRTPGRRLSVPSSTVNPFQSPQTVSTSRTLFSQGPVNASNSGLFSSPNNNSLLTSPTTSTASSWSRRDSASTSADEAWRRRTWHPDTREFSNSVAANNNNNNNSSSSNNNLVNSPPAGGSRFSQIIASSQYQTSPVTSLPIANPATQQMNLRLPGIESFDPIPHHRPVSPLRRAPSPMIVDSDNSPAVGLAAQPSMLRNVESPPDDRRISTGSQWDSSLHRGLTRLDIASGTPPRDSAQSWANEANRAVMAQAEQTLGNYPKQQQQQKLGVRFESDVRMVPAPDAPSMGYSRGHQHTMSAPSFNAATPRQLKRQGWYNGPVSSAAMPGTEFQVGDRGVGSRVERMVHPNLANGFSGFSGFPSRVPQTVHEHQQSPPPPPQDSQHYTRQQQEQDVSDPLSRLEALVAVATSEATAAAAY